MSISERALRASLKLEVVLGLFSLFIFCFAVLSALMPQLLLLTKLVFLSGFFAPLLILMVKYSALNQWLESRDVHGLVTFSGILFAAAFCLAIQAAPAPLLYSVVIVAAPLLLATPVKSSVWAKVPVGAVMMLFVFAAVALCVDPSFAEDPASGTGGTGGTGSSGGLSSMAKAFQNDLTQFKDPAALLCYAAGGSITFFGVHECYKAKQGQGDGDFAGGGKKILVGGALAGTPSIIGMGMKTMGVTN